MSNWPRHLLSSGTLVLALWAAVAAADDIPAIDDVPGDLVAVRPTLVRQHDQLLAEQARFVAAGEAFNAKAPEAQTDEEFERLQHWRTSHIAAVNAFNRELSAGIREEIDALKDRAALTPEERARLRRLRRSLYRPGGDGLVGGTGWILGYSVPDGPEADAIRARACESVRQQSRLAGPGRQYEVDCSRYEFALGVAAAHGEVSDLGRVFFDNLRNGGASAEYQSAYNSLRERRFETLECHSNGAMVCLAAIRNGDILAERVVLFGPQVTLESLALWREQLGNGNIAALEIVVNTGDPIPALSLGVDAVTRGVQVLPWRQAESFARYVGERVSASGQPVTLTPFTCQPEGLFDLSCHSMKTYRAFYHRCRAAAQPSRPVPGTKVRGRHASEPPPPC